MAVESVYMMRRWWPLHAIFVYACLLFFTAAFHQQQAQAASSGFTKFRQVKTRRGGKTVFRKIKRIEGGYLVHYGFKNFNGDRLRVKAKLGAKSVAASIREFGFRRKDFKALDFWYESAQENAIAAARKRMSTGRITARSQSELNGKMRRIKSASARIQSGLDAELARLEKEYRRRRKAIYTKAGFRYKKKGVVEADIPALIRRNWKRVRPIARSFSRIASARKYDQNDLLGAATAWVQTSLRYKIPDTLEGSRTIGGVIPPMKALILGQGDCDSKSALLGSVLSNWPNIKMVGLGIPGHYLMAVHRIPRRGDVYIEHRGLPYVMIESAGPAWLPPGTVGDLTEAYLNSGRNFRIQSI